MEVAAKAISGEAVLIIDQLDAVSTTSGRNPEFFEVVEDLLQEVRGLREKVKLHVVVVCREFDWENDHRLRRLLAKEDAKISVTDFSLDEVKSSLEAGGFNTGLFDTKQLELLLLPQNLSLFLDANNSSGSKPEFFSEKDLFDLYWKEKRRTVQSRSASLSDYWNDVIQKLCNEMTESQQLSVLKEKLDQFPSEYLDRMASEGVLSFDGNSYGFGHETFFDYCFARAFKAKEESLVSFLVLSEQHLFRRAQVRQVLVYLRDADRGQYCRELSGLLTDKRIRDHLKDLAVALAVSMPNPEEDEWNVIAPWIESELEAIKSGKPNPDKFASLVWNRFYFLRSRLKTLNVAEFERAYSSSHIQVSPQTLNRKACMMSTPRMQYATDLTDGQWQRIEPLLPAPRWRLHGPGRPPRDRRQIVNGLLYLNKTGCPWALLPCCFGPWKTGYDYFRRWSLQGVWPQVLDQLTQRERRRNGRAATPSAGCVDSQTIKTATQGKTTGYDAGKKIKGRKRHLLVDTSGLLRQVVVTAADVDDRDGLKQVLTRLKATGVARLRKLWADGGYQGAAIRTWVANRKRRTRLT